MNGFHPASQKTSRRLVPAHHLQNLTPHLPIRPLALGSSFHPPNRALPPSKSSSLPPDRGLCGTSSSFGEGRGNGGASPPNGWREPRQTGSSIGPGSGRHPPFGVPSFSFSLTGTRAAPSSSLISTVHAAHSSLSRSSVSSSSAPSLLLPTPLASDWSARREAETYPNRGSILLVVLQHGVFDIAMEYLMYQGAHLCSHYTDQRRFGLRMGAPKQRWTSEEEAALRAGIARHGVGKWRTILKDPEFSSTLCYRSNVDLKDKWRNMNVIVSTSSSRDKAKTAVKRARTTPKNNEHTMAISRVTSDIDDEIVDEKPIASLPSEAKNTSNSKKSHSRLDNIIMEAIKNLNEPTGSHRTTIANYIEEQYWPPSDFDHLLSAKLKDLSTSGKLIKVNRKYRIAPSSPNSEGRSPKMLLLEDVQREPVKIWSDDSRTLTRSQVDAELARMSTMTAEEASVAAAHAVAEAEAIMAEAEAAAKEAEAAEAEAQAAQAFAEAAFFTLKNRNAAKLMA